MTQPAICTTFPSNREPGMWIMTSVTYTQTKEQFQECLKEAYDTVNTGRVVTMPAAEAREIYGSRKVSTKELNILDGMEEVQ